MTRSRMITIALIISVAFNVLVIGAVAGKWIKHGSFGDHHRWSGDHHKRDVNDPPRWLSRVLDDEGEEVLERVWARHKDAFVPLRQGRLEERLAIADTLLAEPFDPEALKSELAASVERRTQRFVAMQDMLSDLASELSPEQRRELAEKMKRWAERRHGR